MENMMHILLMCFSLHSVSVSDTDYSEIIKALEELDSIHSSKATVEINDPIIIMQDYDGNVYINGGDKLPIKGNLRIGNTINRDFLVKIKTKLYKRESRPDPWFQIKLRAHGGIILPQIVDYNVMSSVDYGIGVEFFHIDKFNLALHAGVYSTGAFVGYDITRNFGFMSGYSLSYSNLRSGLFIGSYFRF